MSDKAHSFASNFFSTLIKSIILFFIFGHMFGIFTLDFPILLSRFISCFLFLIPPVITYFFFTNPPSRQIIIKMLTIYFSMIAFLLTLIFYTVDNYQKIEIDYWKTKLSYAKKQEIPATLNSYEKAIDNYVNQFSLEKITAENLPRLSHNELQHQDSKNIQLYANFSAGALIIVTLFIFLWFITEFEVCHVFF